MHAQPQFITLRDGSGSRAVVAPELGGWLLRYSRLIPKFGEVDALYFSQEVVDRYPNQMYAGNPLLFPQVSFSHLPGAEHHYQLNGQTYALPQHGFARRSKWRVVEVHEARLSMELCDSPETRSAYPFAFCTQVVYELRDGRLHYTQRVQNRGETAIPFSTGIHPYLPLPIGPDSSRDACFVDLPRAHRVVPGAHWNTWSTEPFHTQCLSVAEDVSGTLFLTDLATPEISLVDPNAGLRIVLNFSQAPAHRYVAIWSKSTSAPFYCIEPWTALPNSFSRNSSELIHLPPGDSFQAKMWFDVTSV